MGVVRESRLPVRRSLKREYHPVLRLVPAAALTLVVVGVIAVGVTMEGPALRTADDCPVSGAPKSTLVLGVDTTDRLVSEEPRAVRANLEEALAALDPGSRVAVVEIGATAPTEPKLLFDRCLPGRSDNAARNRLRDDVMKPIAKRLEELAAAPEAPTSAIIETVLSVATDRHLHPAGSTLTMMVESDGLQNTDYASAYHNTTYPQPPAGALNGVTVRLDPLRNRRDAARQPGALTALVAWLDGAGAERVDYRAPSWLALSKEARRAPS